MSIINDALKKVQKNLEQKKQTQNNNSQIGSNPGDSNPAKTTRPLQEQNQRHQDPLQKPSNTSILQSQKHPAIKSTPSPKGENPPSPDDGGQTTVHGYTKKGGMTTNINDVPPAPPPPTASQNADQPPQKKTHAIIIVFCFILLSLGLAIGIRVFNQPNIRNASGKGQLNKEGLLLGLKLEGTMMMSNKDVALISGEIYEEGDSLNGMIVKEIRLNTVVLEDKDGDIKTLKRDQNP